MTITLDERLKTLRKEIADAIAESPMSAISPTLIAVSKRQPDARIEEALRAGLRDFGENQVQEAMQRWEQRKKHHPDLVLHLIGPLQSNKTAQAVSLFDVIHTVDREKIAASLAREMRQQQRALPCYIQINIGNEPQKAGIAPTALDDFLLFCREDCGLNIVGLMCIPPADEPSAPFFAQMQTLARTHGLSRVSMGMSQDYKEAIRFGATDIRLGTALLGERPD